MSVSLKKGTMRRTVQVGKSYTFKFADKDINTLEYLDSALSIERIGPHLAGLIRSFRSEKKG